VPVLNRMLREKGNREGGVVRKAFGLVEESVEAKEKPYLEAL